MKYIKVEGERTCLLKEIKRGEFFRFSENGRTFVKDYYERGEKKYCYYAFDDMNYFKFAKGTRKIFVGFTF